MARFMSGEENTKYDRVVDSELSVRIDGVVYDYETFRNEVNEKFDMINSHVNSLNSGIHYIDEKYEKVLVFHDTYNNSVLNIIHYYTPILLTLLTTPLMRALNCIFHWYYIHLFKDGYDGSYYMTFDICGVDSRYKWKDYRAQYKKNLKEIKRDKVRYKDIKIRI